MSPDIVSFTIAICTWNRCDLLRQTLDRLTAIVPPDDVQWDILVVNNNCTDGTSDVVASFAGRLPIREVFEAVPGLSHARNRALDEVKRDYIVWIDDDVLVDDAWMPAFAAAVRQHRDVHAFGGPITPWFVKQPDPDVLAAFPVLQRGFCGLDHGTQQIVLAATQPIYGANMAYAMSAVRTLRFDAALGPVKESNYGEDEVEFQARLRAAGGRVMWVPGMRVRHYVDPARMTLEYLAKFTYDRGRAQIRRRGSVAGPKLLGAPRWVWPLMAGASARYWLLRLTPLRRAMLEGMRDYHQYRGMIAESFAQSRAGRQSTARGAGVS